MFTEVKRDVKLAYLVEKEQTGKNMMEAIKKAIKKRIE
jgi:hypothetical protein